MVNTVDAAKTLLPVGLKDNKRDDGYLAGAITVEDFTTQVGDTVRPYKVFTALLTQSGGDNPDQEVDGVQTIIKGVTYQIINVAEGDDLTKIGAPNNNLGTKFIASRDAIGEFNGATILFYNTGAPVATVLENTIGNIWFSYDDTGQYGINLADTFIEEKTFILTPSSGYDSAVLQGGGGDPYSIYRFSDNKCVILTSNGSLNKTPIEIRVYN